jgi:hypothetical protein
MSISLSVCLSTPCVTFFVESDDELTVIQIANICHQIAVKSKISYGAFDRPSARDLYDAKKRIKATKANIYWQARRVRVLLHS